MDSSDFYPIAVQALEALSPGSTSDQRYDARMALTSFIESADREHQENNSRANYRAHLKEGEV